jgi:hypothetical protein
MKLPSFDVEGILKELLLGVEAFHNLIIAEVATYFSQMTSSKV